MKRTVVVLFSLVFLLIIVVASRGTAVSDVDALAYTVSTYGDGTTLYLYDTSSGKTTVHYQDDGRLHFVFGSHGLIALSTDWTWENNGELFILDTTESEPPLVNLSQQIGMAGYPLGWSDDGSYLAFASEIDDGQRQAIYVWDGTSTTDITPQNMPGIPHSFDIAWSPDGCLAFTIWFGSSNHDPRSEIYIWDGETTFNLSQNVDAEDREPVWNTRGELAFGSYRDNEMMLLLWDGISYVDGLPDMSSFTRVAPQLRIFSPDSTWVNDDLLAFEGFEPDSSQIQIFDWNGQTWSNISQNSDAHSYGAQWGQDGYWAFVTDERRLYVRDPQNNTVFETAGWYMPAWSSGGSLIFCDRIGRGPWKLSRWDRASVSTLVQGDIIYAQWRSGQEVVCSDG
ncbi:MAG: hypothetical protein KC547_10580 [Anaerolineae bacterium]|nr:hypothetical protein [Anaerolineae bacterium]